MPAIVKTAPAEQFFANGRRLARLADTQQPLPMEHTISFEDPADMLTVITASRLAVFHAVQQQADSITALAQRLQRDRSAVKRDVDHLARAGLLAVESRVLPGHGRMKHVRAVAQRVRLQAVL